MSEKALLHTNLLSNLEIVMGSTRGIWGRSNIQQRALEKLIFGDYILMIVLGQEKRLFPNRSTSYWLRRGHMISKNRKVFPAKVFEGAMQNLWRWKVNTLFPTRKLTARGYLLNIFVQFFLPWKKIKTVCLWPAIKCMLFVERHLIYICG